MKKNIRFLVNAFLAAVFLLGMLSGNPASPSEEAQSSLSDPARGAKDPRYRKVIDFEDELVEGVNKRPLDSLSQISEADRKKKKPHLYRKRAGFRSETQQTISELRYSQ